jgi:hypothetical protein
MLNELEAAEALYSMHKYCDEHRYHYYKRDCTNCGLLFLCEHLYTYLGEPITLGEAYHISEKFRITEEEMEEFRKRYNEKASKHMD